MEKINTLVIASGYFNPIHKGHIEYLNRSKAIGDFLYVIVNNDYQRSLKGSKEFQTQDERRIIVKNIKSVDDVIVSIDKNRQVANTIKLIYLEMRSKFDKIIFTNGGDQTTASESEKRVCDELGIEMVFGLGGKIQSSSWLINKL
jgi:cytidyltransferase-like protein